MMWFVMCKVPVDESVLACSSSATITQGATDHAAASEVKPR